MARGTGYRFGRLEITGLTAGRVRAEVALKLPEGDWLWGPRRLLLPPSMGRDKRERGKCQVRLRMLVVPILCCGHEKAYRGVGVGGLRVACFRPDALPPVEVL